MVDIMSESYNKAAEDLISKAVYFNFSSIIAKAQSKQRSSLDHFRRSYVEKEGCTIGKEML